MAPKYGCIVALSLLGSACYSADLTADLSGVYACEETVDCALGQICAAGICRAEGEIVGPSIEVTDPPLLHVFEQGTRTLPLSLEGSHLRLTAEASEGLEDGYVEVYLDGALVDAVTEGDLERGVDVLSLPMPQEGGLHHVVLSARKVDGERFDNYESEAHVAFWVDDGLEHVGILEPAPAARIPQDKDDLRIEVAALNFTFVNPGFLPPDGGAEPLQGYVHLFVDADVPSCLPSCNYEYQTSIVPPGLARVNRLIADRGPVLPSGIGTIHLQIVAQTPSNTPYYRDDSQMDLVYYDLPVQSVVNLEP